jgi:hypothetical protein
MVAKMVTVNSFENAAEAYAAKHRLEADGIAAIVTDEAVGNWLGYMGTAIGGIKVQVAEADVARSREILFTRPVASDAAPWRCRRCQELVQGDFELCWSCGGEREEVEDPDFSPEPKPDQEPAEAMLADDDVANAPPPSADIANAGGQPNPYLAGNLPAATLAGHEVVVGPGGEEIEAMVTRAWRASVLGIFLCPTLLLVNFYSAWLLLQVSLSQEELSPSAALRYRLAWAVNFLAVFVVLGLLSLVFGVSKP